MIGMTGGRRLEDIRDLFMYCTLGEIEFLLLFSRKFLSFSGLRHDDSFYSWQIFKIRPLFHLIPGPSPSPFESKSETTLDFHQDGL